MRLLVVLGFVYLVLRPVSSNAVLVPVLAVLGAMAAAAWARNRQPLAAPWRTLFYLQLLLGVFGATVATINSNPGLAYGVLVFLAAPVLFWCYVGSLSKRIIRALLGSLAAATSVLSMGILLYVLGEQGVLPDVLPAALLEQTGAGFRDLGGSTEIRLYGLSSLTAAGPLWFASLLIPPDELMPRLRWRICAAATALAASVVGGRQAILIVFVLAPLLLWSCRRLLLANRPTGREVRVAPVTVSAVLLGLALYIGSVSIVPSLFPSQAISKAARGTQSLALGGSDAQFADDNVIRRDQAERLLGAWTEAPALGRGFGAVVPGYQRSTVRPWNFELQYHLLLFQTGLVGLLIVVAMGAVVISGLRSAVAACPALSSTLLVTSTGGLAMLIANGTNPYLQAPGHMWAVYLPLAVANVMLLPVASANGRPATASRRSASQDGLVPRPGPGGLTRG